MEQHLLEAAAVLSCGEAMSDLSDWPKKKMPQLKKKEKENKAVERLDFRVDEPQRQQGKRK